MDFVELSNDEFSSFVAKSSLKNYVQTVEFKILREALGSKCYLLGVKEDNVVIAATFIYQIKSFLGKQIFYAPKGYILDYKNEKLLNFFTQKVIEFAKKRNGFKIIIDPEIIYQIRNNDGEVIEGPSGMEIANLEKIGYQHFGFNVNFETLQVRFQSVLPLKSSYEETLDSFAKTTKNNILKTNTNGLDVRKAKRKDDIITMYRLFEATAENKNFRIRSLDYYQKLFDILPDIVNVYLVALNFIKEAASLKSQLNEAKEELSRVEEEMKRVNVGAKMINKKELILQKIVKINNQINLNKINNEKYGEQMDIGALLSIKSMKEYCTITSGMLEEFKNYGPKYAMYNAHIKDAFLYGVERVNFCGISGNFDSKNPLYKIFELKKGFNGYVEEFVGEFSITFGFWGRIYQFLKKFRKGE